MASQQVSKKDTHAEEPKVLKLAQHFEELGKDPDPEAQKGERADSVEDIGKYRAQAQQNSMEAIRAAEERYEKAKKAALGEEPADEGQGGGKKEKDTTEQYMDATAGEETGHLEGQRGSDYTTAAKDTVVTVGKTVIDYTKQAAEQAKDVAANVGKSAVGTTAEIGKSAAGYAGAKAVQAKDAVVETGLLAAHYTLQKAVQVTEVTADVGHKSVEYTGEKTGEVKQERVQKEEEAQEHAAEVQESRPSQGKDAPKFDEYKEAAEQSGPDTGKQGSSLIGAVGEAFYEIAQTTKKMVMGKDPEQKE